MEIRIVTAWNNLPDEIVNTPSINTFKNQLDRYWKDQDILYDYKALLNTLLTRKDSEISVLSSNQIDINQATDFETPKPTTSPEGSTDANKKDHQQEEQQTP